jgi:hypothetical protein
VGYSLPEVSSGGTATGGSSGGSGGTSYNEHRAYLDQTYPGGSSAYIRSQQQRYQEAVRSGDIDLQNRLRADAARVGYTLPEMGSAGTSRSLDLGTILGLAGVGLGALGSIAGAVNPALGTSLNLASGGLGQAAQQVAGGNAVQPMPPLPYIQQPVDLTAQLNAVIAPYINELQRIAQGVDAETAPIVSQAYNQIMDMINSTEQSLIQRFNQLGQGVDPATQAALASLKETVQRQRENLMEEMSRRGLLQSGIWLEMENRLNQGLLTEQQRLLAARLSDLQNQLNQALMNLGQARIQATSQFGAEQIRLAEAAAQRRQQALSDLINAAMEAQRQILEQQQRAQELAWEQYKYFYPSWEQQAQYTGTVPAMYPGDPSATIRYAQRMWGEANKAGDQAAMDYWHQVAEQARAAAGWPSGGESGLLTESLMTQAGLPTAEMEKAMLPYRYPTANALVPYVYGPTPAEMLPYQYPTANALVPYQYGPTPYQREQLSISRSRLAQAAAQASRSDIIADNLAKAQAEIWSMLNSGVPLDQVEAMIWKNASKYTQAGLKASDLVDYAWQAATGYPKPKTNPQ